MRIKNTSIRLATVVLVLAVGLPLTAVADKAVKMDLRFAGAFSTSILHLDPMTGNIVLSASIEVQAKGSPGKAVIRGFGGRDMPPGAPVEKCLDSTGLFLKISILENPLVFTFEDLSLLFQLPGKDRYHRELQR